MFHLLMHYRIIALKSALSDNENNKKNSGNMNKAF
jgi:hypothetical protein